MINCENMVSLRSKESLLPIATNQEVSSNLHSKIKVIRRSVELPVRIGFPTDSFASNPVQRLFFLTAEEYSYLEDMNGKKIRRVEPNRFQAVGFEVMKEYGFDEGTSRPMHKGGGFNQNGIVDYPDGSSGEYRRYPSGTIKGLVFECSKRYVTATGKVISVGWKVTDNAPIFRINLGRKAKK